MKTGTTKNILEMLRLADPSELFAAAYTESALGSESVWHFVDSSSSRISAARIVSTAAFVAAIARFLVIG